MGVTTADLRRERLGLEAATTDAEVTRTGTPAANAKRTTTPDYDYNQLPTYETPAFPAQTNVSARSAVSLEHYPDDLLERQISALRGRPSVDDQKELAALQAEVARRRQGPSAPSATAFTSSLEGDVAELSRARGKVESNVQRVLGATPEAADAARRAARDEIIGETETLKAHHERATKDLAQIQEMDPAAREDMTKRGVFAQLEATKAALEAQINRNVEVAQRLSVVPVLAEALGAAKTAGDALDFLNTAAAATKNKNVSDRELDALVPQHDAQLKALTTQIGALKKREADAREVVKRLSRVPAGERTARQSIELADAQRVLDGVIPGEGNKPPVSIHEQIQTLSHTAAIVSVAREKIARRCDVLQAGVDAQLRLLGERPTLGKGPDAIWAGMKRVAELLGTTVPLQPANGNFGQVNQLATGFLVDTTTRKEHMLTAAALVLHKAYGIDIVPFDAMGNPQLPGLTAIDAKLAEGMKVLAAHAEGSPKLSAVGIALLSNAAPPVDPNNAFVKDVAASRNRMQHVSSEGLNELVGIASDTNFSLTSAAPTTKKYGGKLTVADLKAMSVDLSATQAARETAGAILGNPEFVSAEGISAGALRELASQADRLGPIPVSLFYKDAFRDAARLRSALASKDQGAALAVLGGLSQSKRQMLALAYGQSLSQDLRKAFSGADLGRVSYVLQRPLPSERVPEEEKSIADDPTYLDKRINEVDSTLATYRSGGYVQSALGLRAKGLFDGASNPETELRTRLDVVKQRRDDVTRALASKDKDPEAIASARTELARALAECKDCYVRVTTEVGAQVAATDAFLKSTQAVATAVTVTAVATAVTIGTCGAATPYAGAAAATAIGIAAGTIAGAETGALISIAGQAIEKNGRIDWNEVDDRTRDAAVTAFGASVTAGATAGLSGLAMDGVMTAANATRAGAFLQRGSRLAAASNVAIRGVSIGAASAGSAAIGSVGGAAIRAATGDRQGADAELAGLGENALRAGISGALLSPFAGRFNGVRGAIFDGAAAGLEQYGVNKMTGRDASEGVGAAITNGVVIGRIIAKHGDVMAAKKLGTTAAEGHPVRLPGEKAPSWKIVSVDAASGQITLEPLTPKAGAAATTTLGAAALLEANESAFGLARPEVEQERSRVMKRLVPDENTRATLEASLRETREQRASMTPEAYRAKVEKVVGDATEGASRLDAEGRAAARKRLEALPNAARDPRVQELLSLLDAGAGPKGAETQALVAMELAGTAETQLKADHARARTAMTAEQIRDAIAEMLTKSGVMPDEAEIAAANRTATAPRLEKLAPLPAAGTQRLQVIRSVTARMDRPAEVAVDPRIENQKTAVALKAAWAKTPELERPLLGALVRSAGFKELPRDTQRALLEGPQHIRGVLAEELGRHGGDKTAATTLAQLALSPGFQAMGRPEQEHLLRYVGGTNTEISAPARRALADWLNNDEFQSWTPKKQQDRLQEFVRLQPGRPYLVPASSTSWKTPQTTARISAPTNVPLFNFGSGAKPARRYEIEIDGRKLVVVESTRPHDPKLFVHSPEEMRRALEMLPKQVRDQIKEIHLDSDPSNWDTYWQNKHNNPNHRSYMTADSARGVVNVHPTVGPPRFQEAVGTLAHEAGHLDSFRRWTRNHSDDPTSGVTADPQWTPWKDAMTNDKLAPSTYAKSDPAEDFAESYRLYAQIKGTPREAELRNIMPERFRILDAIWAGGAP